MSNTTPPAPHQCTTTPYQVNGVTGYTSKRPCIVFAYPNSNGTTWYVAQGGTMVNMTYDPVEEGVDIDALEDVSVFTWEPINDLDQLVEAVEA